MSQYASWGFGEGEEIAPGRAVLTTLGGGNRYEACLVWDESLFALAVAKVLRPDQAEDERALRDLGREVEALEALAHPSLVRCFDAVLAGRHPHVLIEHLEGPSLRRLIKRDGAIALDQLLPLAAHVAGALQYMANNGYVHLDVKPDNIIMGVPPRLIDLSIARTLERAEKDGGADRDRPLHGPRAVRTRAWDDRGRRGFLGPGRDALPRDRRRKALSARRRGPGERPLPAARRAASGATRPNPGGAPAPDLRAARPRSSPPSQLRRCGRAARAADRRAAAQDEADPARRHRRLNSRVIFALARVTGRSGG